MKKMISRSLIVLTALVLAACATSAGGGVTVGGKRPAWIDGESPEYPRADNVLGVGSADDDNSAADRARGEVARVFSATISVESSVAESESNSSSNGKEAHSFTQNVAENVRTATKKALEGVDIVARWKDPSTMRYYALAALPKAQALSGVKQKLSEIDLDVARYSTQLAQATDKFERAKNAAKLVALLKPRADLEAESRVLGGGADPASPDASKIRADATQALAALDVVVAVSGDGAPEVLTGVVTGMNNAGLNAKSGTPDDKGDMVASAQVALAPVEAGPRWQRTRATASVTLQDGRDSKMFSRFDLSAREDAMDAGESRKRALATLAKKASDAVTKAINDFFANQ